MFQENLQFLLKRSACYIWLFELVPKYIHKLIRINTKNWKFSLLRQRFAEVWKTIKNSGNHLWQVFFCIEKYKNDMAV